MQKPLVAILAGGTSRRFGSDKSQVRIGALTLLNFLIKRVEETGCSVVVIGRVPTLGEQWHGLPDRQPDTGPAEGLATALNHAASSGYEEVLLLAVDLPLITSRFLNWLMELPPSEAVIPVLEGRKQFCAARYATTVFAQIDQNLRQGKRSLQQQVASLEHQTYIIPDELADACRSFNTPSELNELRHKGQPNE